MRVGRRQACSLVLVPIHDIIENTKKPEKKLTVKCNGISSARKIKISK